jgi:glycosyltransferase involved in cell wall biosynthesis
MMKRLDGVIACAATQAEYLVREEGVGRSNLTGIFNGVDPDRFHPAGEGELPPLEEEIKPAERLVGIVASLTPEKGHDVFVEAAALTLADLPDTRFLIVGEGPEREKIEKQIREKGLQKEIILLGRRRDLPALLPRLDLLALSSHPFRETLPISTMEGMACAVPTVNTDVGSVRDLVVDGETGLIVPPGDAEKMAAAFRKILLDPHLAGRMGRAARRRIVDRFTLDRTAGEYRRYFERIISGKGGD